MSLIGVPSDLGFWRISTFGTRYFINFTRSVDVDLALRLSGACTDVLGMPGENTIEYSTLSKLTSPATR